MYVTVQTRTVSPLAQYVDKNQSEIFQEVSQQWTQPLNANNTKHVGRLHKHILEQQVTTIVLHFCMLCS